MSWRERPRERRPDEGRSSRCSAVWTWAHLTAGRSGRVNQADLTGSTGESLLAQFEIAEALQETLTEVKTAEQLERRAAVLFGQMLQQTAHLEHLQEQMSNLQQVIEGLEDVGPLAVGVLQVSRRVGILLEVKALIFDFA